MFHSCAAFAAAFVERAKQATCHVEKYENCRTFERVRRGGEAAMY
jgi:hypothetical protein